ncbi:MAG: hypothetical protein PHH93_01230 [Prolixibacteraceae bacterium]|nr:hypothetical protein [Prolixibacteraceae bacterium]
MHNILSIAKYERKTLFRSWFFRIFSVLSLGVLFLMNFGMIIQGGGDQGWAMRSIPAAIPYSNLLILNVAQAIIAVFLASDFLKRDKKLDTTEVIYMRSMTNGDYVIGKTLGNLQVFLILNIAVVLMALIFNMLSQGIAVKWEAYLIYLLLISIPTLIFIMGLSFLLMSIIRNQAITFVIILGYIGITLFVLEARYYYIFDYMAFNIPMLISDIAGMGNLEKVLIHRGIYFSLGVSFILMTIFLLKRLPQSQFMTYFSLIFAILFFISGAYLGTKHIGSFKGNDRLRNEAIELNNIYVKEKLPATLSHNIILEHRGNSIEAVSKLSIINEREETIQKFVLSLNSGFNVKSFRFNGSETPYTRRQHLIILDQGVTLQPDEKAEIEIEYGGNVSETLCYLDISNEELQEKYGKFVLNVDKRFAFLTPDYVLLTPEVSWYPKVGVTYSTNDVSWNHPEFVDFQLEVKTLPGLQAVSQGEISKIAEGHFKFNSNVPLTRISLAIGNYEKKTLVTDKCEYGVWHIKNHDFFIDAFPEIQDTVAQLINERMGDFERTYNLEYVFDRLFLVEVPAQFKTYERIWSGQQEYVQPEIVYIPEKGYLLREADFENAKKRMERWGNRGGGSMTEKDKEIRILYDFLGLFTREQTASFRGGPGGFSAQEGANPYFIFPMLYNFQNNIYSENWPITNRIFEAYLKSQSVDMRSIFRRDMQGISEDELANIALQDSTFEEILADPMQKKIIDNVIKLKGEALFSRIQWEAGQQEFEQFLRELLREFRFKNILFKQFDERIKEKFGVELIPIMDDWFMEKALPGYLFSPVEAVKVTTGEWTQTMISLKATNFSSTGGIVKFTFRLGGGGGPGMGFGRGGSAEDIINKLVYIEPNQTKDIGFLLDSDPRMMIINTLTSKNIPQVIMESFREIEEDPKAVPFEGEILTDVPVSKQLPGEIIVDNEDPQFEITSNSNISLLERWLIKRGEGELKYSGMNYWRPPVNWTSTTNSDFFGEYIRSGYYVKSGDGSIKARWHVSIEEPGYYEVYYHLYKQRNMGRRGGREERGDYQFYIFTEEGVVEQSLSVNNAENGWNNLGSFYFSSDTALVELTNKSELRIVFADAVRLVKL